MWPGLSGEGHAPVRSTHPASQRAEALTAGGSERVTKRVTLGRTSIDRKRTSAAEENRPICAACRRMAGMSAMVLYHSCQGAHMAAEVSAMGRVGQALQCAACEALNQRRGSPLCTNPSGHLLPDCHRLAVSGIAPGLRPAVWGPTCSTAWMALASYSSLNTLRKKPSSPPSPSPSPNCTPRKCQTGSLFHLSRTCHGQLSSKQRQAASGEATGLITAGSSSSITCWRPAAANGPAAHLVEVVVIIAAITIATAAIENALADAATAHAIVQLRRRLGLHAGIRQLGALKRCAAARGPQVLGHAGGGHSQGGEQVASTLARAGVLLQ